MILTFTTFRLLPTERWKWTKLYTSFKVAREARNYAEWKIYSSTMAPKVKVTSRNRTGDLPLSGEIPVLWATADMALEHELSKPTRGVVRTTVPMTERRSIPKSFESRSAGLFESFEKCPTVLIQAAQRHSICTANERSPVKSWLVTFIFG